MKTKIYRSKAPLRIGYAGGGTDVSPFSEIHGGYVLNATLNMFAFATIQPRTDGKIIFESKDLNEVKIHKNNKYIKPKGKLILLQGVYNRIIKQFNKDALSCTITTYVDAPAGSGLGTSSTLVVALIGAFMEWLKLPLGEYDIAHLAYDIERKDLGMSGGKQDQYAATFGGFNFIEFYRDEKVIVNPLRIKSEYLSELEFNTLLYFTGRSRFSSNIIEAQRNNVQKKNSGSIEAMLKLKEQAILMKEAILKGKIDEIGEILDFGWKYKKQTAAEVSNPFLDEIYETACKAGSTGGKISGAGGGGFMFFYCPKNSRYNVIEAIQKKHGGEFRRFQFTTSGLQTWSI